MLRVLCVNLSEYFLGSVYALDSFMYISPCKQYSFWYHSDKFIGGFPFTYTLQFLRYTVQFLLVFLRESSRFYNHSIQGKVFCSHIIFFYLPCEYGFLMNNKGKPQKQKVLLLMAGPLRPNPPSSLERWKKKVPKKVIFP